MALGPRVRMRLAAGDLAAQPLRTTLAVVVLAPLVATWFLLAALSTALTERPGGGPARTLIVTGAELFDPSVVVLREADRAAVSAAAGDAADLVTPVVVRLVDVEGRTLQLRGADPATWAAVDRLVLRQGRAPSGTADEVAITSSVQAATGWTLGRVIRVFGTEFTITGVYDAGETKVAALWMTRERAELLFERPGEYQFLAVHLAPGSDGEAVRSRLQQGFPDLVVVDESRVQVEISRGRRVLGELARLFVTVGFAGLAAGSANATALMLAERTRSIGLLRVLGFAPAELRRILAVRALLVTAGALVVGLAVAAPIVASRPAFLLNTYPVRWRVGPLTTLAGIAASLAGSWLGAGLAARRTVRRPIRSLLGS